MRPEMTFLMFVCVISVLTAIVCFVAGMIKEWPYTKKETKRKRQPYSTGGYVRRGTFTESQDGVLVLRPEDPNELSDLAYMMDLTLLDEDEF